MSGNSKICGVDVEWFRNDVVNSLENLLGNISSSYLVEKAKHNLEWIIYYWKRIDFANLNIEEKQRMWRIGYKTVPAIAAKVGYGVNSDEAHRCNVRMRRVALRVRRVADANWKVPEVYAGKALVEGINWLLNQSYVNSSVLGIGHSIETAAEYAKVIDLSQVSAAQMKDLIWFCSDFLPRILRHAGVHGADLLKLGKKHRSELTKGFELIRYLAETCPYDDSDSVKASDADTVSVVLPEFDVSEGVLADAWSGMVEAFDALDYGALSPEGQHFIDEAVNVYLPTLISGFRVLGTGSSLAVEAEESFVRQLDIICTRFEALHEEMVVETLRGLEMQEQLLSAVAVLE